MSTKPVIYQLFVRLFGNINQTHKAYGTITENGCGKFNDITPLALSEIKKMGITHIWFTGIIAHTTLTDYSEFGISHDFPEITKGRAGSPYAIKDYYTVDPDLAVDVKQRMKEFENLVDRTHKSGMKVIVDFVPNHVARNYKSENLPENTEDFGASDQIDLAFHPNNNYYYLPDKHLVLPMGMRWIDFLSDIDTKARHYSEFPAKVTGNDQFTEFPTVFDWYETVKLNYGVDFQNERRTHFIPVPSTWLKMKDILMFWASKKIDGFRCDMAEMVPIEFWKWVIPQVKTKFPDIIFIAEIYNPYEYENFIYKAGFNYLYDKIGFYDLMRSIIEGKSPASDISRIWQSLNGLDSYMLRFIENHDEQRVASRQFAGTPEPGWVATVLAATMNKGPVMIYSGQEVGEPARGVQGFSGDDGKTSIFDYCGVPEHQNWMNNGRFDGALLKGHQIELRNKYAWLLNFCNQAPAITSGNFYDLMWCNTYNFAFNQNKLYVFLRYKAKQRFIIILNFDSQSSYQFRLKIPPDAFELMGMSAGTIYKLVDIQENSDFGSFRITEAVSDGLPVTINKCDVRFIEITE